jgi:hypothetical protein
MLEPRVPIINIQHEDLDTGGGILAAVGRGDAEGVAVPRLVVQLATEDHLSPCQDRELFTWGNRWVIYYT